jgi:hypothetical protein
VQWQKLYESCAFERNLEKLNKLVFATEDAIYLRSRELSNESYIADEVQALRRAANGLLEIKIKKLGWSDPAKVNSSNPETNRRTLADEQGFPKRWVFKSSEIKTS